MSQLHVFLENMGRGVVVVVGGRQLVLYFWRFASDTGVFLFRWKRVQQRGDQTGSEDVAALTEVVSPDSDLC